MVNAANSSMQEADAVILVVDTGKEITSVEENVMAYLKKSGIPAILVLNKIDMYRREDIAEPLAK
jgi:predicted GTPase